MATEFSSLPTQRHGEEAKIEPCITSFRVPNLRLQVVHATLNSAIIPLLIVNKDNVAMTRWGKK